MAKQLNVNLAFTADTSKAKAQIQDLQRQLSNLTNRSFSDNINTDIQKALKSTIELQTHLNKAVNTKTGNLDFSKLSESLKQSGKSLEQYGKNLRQLGPDGQKAFQALATSVANAEIPIRRSNEALSEMWVSLKNTARWQISSSILHGFMGAVQQAYGYAKDLNESLNNIRIVTGQNTEQMAQFAERANKAAKALSATTTEYTNASLIYYQQGLNDQEVQDRTDITIKMAHASRQSAEIVSDQLTALWNNFYDGSQSLEHYADVLTKLGAETASSSEEISTGLEKFAAIGDMIGLSYDNAAAALATVTATTRQSADVVGTAFKTIFARVQGLSLGETLDDGTNLNKYSKALEKVGISIYEQNGQLKDMDLILAEMGDKWDTLNKDQQVALAQTVAGVRQYNQLVALMDNYDFYQQNLISAQNAEGSLQAQADIYAESWEAAQDRVKAASQAIFQDLLKDEVFIDILNAIEKILTGLDKFIDNIGGLGGVLTSLGAIITKVFSNQLAQSLTNAAYSVKMMTAKGREEIQNKRKSFLDKAAGITANEEYTTDEEKARSEALRDQLTLQSQLLDKADKMSEIELQTNKTLMDRARLLGENKIKAAENLDQQKERVSDNTFNAKTAVAQRAMDNNLGNLGIKETQEQFTNFQQKLKTGIDIRTNLPAELEKMSKSGKSLKKQLEYIKGQARKLEGTDLEKFANKLKTSNLEGEQLEQTLIQIMAHINGIINESQEGIINLGVSRQEAEELIESMYDCAEALQEVDRTSREAAEAQKTALDSIGESNGAQKGWADHMVNIANTTMATISVIQTLGGVWDTISNPDATPWEKVSAVMMGLTTIVPMLTMALNKESIQSLAAASAAIAHAFGLNTEAVAAEIAAGATKSFGIVLYSVLLPIGLVIAAIAALTAGIMALISVYNADADAANKAASTAQNLANKSQDAQAAVEDLLATFDTYDNAINKLEECVEGTEEWENALKNVNDQIWSILEKYPELAKMDNLFKDDGTLNRITIDNFIAKKQNQADNAKAASLTANARASKARVIADKTDIRREINSTISNIYGADNTQVQYLGSKMFDDLYSLALQENLSAEEFNNAVNKYVESFSGAEIEIRQAAAEIKELGNSAKAAKTQMENVGRLVAKEVLGPNATNEQIEDFTKIYADIEDIRYQEILEQTKIGINANSGKLDPEVQKLWNEYLAAIGENYSLSSDAVHGNDNNREFEYINEEGIKVVVSAEEVAATIAAANAQEEAQTKSRTDIIDSLGDVGSKINKAVDTSLLNTLASVIDVEDKKTIEALTLLLSNAESAAEQEKIIEEIISKLTPEQQEALEVNEITTKAVSAFELNADDIEDQAKRIKEAYKDVQGEYQLTTVEATKLAIENQRMNKGVKSLSENWEDWSKTLKKGVLNKEEKLTIDYTNTVQDLTSSIADLVGASKDLELPDEFFENEKNLKLIEEAAKGSTQAINELGIAVGYISIKTMELSPNIDSDGEILNQEEIDSFISNKEIVLAGIEELQAKVVEGTDLVGQGLENILNSGSEGANSWIESLNQMAIATNMTVDEMNSLLNQLGLEADVTIKNQEVETLKPVTRTRVTTPSQVYGDDGQPIAGAYEYDTYSYIADYVPVKEMMQIAQIDVNDQGNGSEPNVKFIGNGSVSGTSSNAGGGSKSTPAKPVKKTKKSSIIDRYKEQNDVLDNLQEALGDVNKESDRAFGKNRLALMEKEQKILLKQKEALEAKAEVAKKYLAIDKQMLIDTANKYGINFEFDADTGDILNYTVEMEKLFNELTQAEEEMNNLSTKEKQDEFKEKNIAPIEEKISELKEAISIYDETKESLEDYENEIQEAFWAWQDREYDKLTYKIELKIDVNESELDLLEFDLKLLEDNFYKMSESFIILSDQGNLYKETMQIYRDSWHDAEQARKEGRISEEKYIEKLKDSRDGIQAQLEALIDLDNQMMHYYRDTLTAAGEEVSNFTEHMAHLTSVFDHYLSLIDILGKKKDYNTMGDFLSGKAETIEDRLKTSQEYYNMLKENSKADEYWKNYQNALEAEDAEMAAWWKEQWDAEIETLDAAQEEMLSLTEEWASSMKAVIENNMAKITEALEKALTGGTTFDTLMDSFDKLNTRQEEYLTKTNQIYETNKLMRTASKALDETDNKVAKQKFNNFIEETKKLQENTKLSQYELEIQQAKYDLLLAEIALEEAQNAKATVRLSRDSEGNFGYVYTADQDAIDDAEQGVDDAKNKLYNLSLEGQQEYTEKYLQAEEEMYNALAELQQAFLNGEIANEEEYQRKKEEILKHYLGPDGVLTTYQSLYNIAVRTDAAATQDFWAAEYGEMTQNTQDWRDAVNQYLIDIEEQTEEWGRISEQVNTTVQDALDDSKTATKNLTDESRTFKDMIKNQVVPAIEKEIKAVQSQTREYANQRAELLKLIDAYRQYLNEINSAIQSESYGDEKRPDYSLNMTNAEFGSLEYIKNLEKRYELENSGYDVGSATTLRIHTFLKNGLSLKDLGYNYYTDIAEDEWKKLVGFNTGGYTGDWGPEGKLAVLHEKELVLNSQDTANFLDAVSFMREIISLIDNQASIAGMYNQMNIPGITSSNQNFEQKVEIYAEFPSATNHTEIEEAFNNLLNTASQYANRKF